MPVDYIDLTPAGRIIELLDGFFYDNWWLHRIDYERVLYSLPKEVSLNLYRYLTGGEIAAHNQHIKRIREVYSALVELR